MIYRPSPGPRLWDTWLFDDEGRFHLFHLVRQGLSSVGGCDGVGHAVSEDLVYWKPRPIIQTLGAEGEWDSPRTHTGMVIRHENRYVMFYGTTDNGVQRVGFMESEDLEHWQKHPANPVMSPGAPHYQSEADEFGDADWRDPFVMWLAEEQCYETFICARQAEWGAGVGACIGRARSRDLIRWEMLPPVAAEERFCHMEVPEHFELAGRHYLIFSTTSLAGARLNTARRERASGTFYMIADRRTGPYRLPEDYLLLGSGEGRFDCYVGRSIARDGERLLYHHNCGPRPAFGAPKRIEAAADGPLHLRYWPGLAALETSVLRDGFSGEVAPLSAPVLADWSVEGGELHGQARPMNAAVLLPEVVADAHVTCRVSPHSCSRAALLFRFDVDSAKGWALTLNYETGFVELSAATVTNQKAVRLQTLDKVRVPLEGDKPVLLRVLVRAEFADCYLDDRWLFSAVLGEEPSAGHIGLGLAGGRATFDELRVAGLESLA